MLRESQLSFAQPLATQQGFLALDFVDEPLMDCCYASLVDLAGRLLVSRNEHNQSFFELYIWLSLAATESLFSISSVAQDAHP